MSLYCYQKAEPKIRHQPNRKINKSQKKLLSLFFSIFGLVLVGNAIIPLLNYQFRYSTSFRQTKMVSPLVQERSRTLGSIAASAHEEDKDYTLITSWFEETPKTAVRSDSGITDYRISIPKLNIDNAWVSIGGEDLKKKLIHYPDTAPPGQMGNSVVFGHSILPQFYNPKNYVSIFSTLHTLDSGDKIILDYDGIKYEYLVEKMFEVPPTDVSVLEQRYDGRYLTLITCSPPGTYLRRLIVKARLVD
jgi:sortase A